MKTKQSHSSNTAQKESPKLIAITVRLTQEQYEDLKIFGIRHRLTTQRIAVEAIKEYIENKTHNQS